MRAQLQDVGVEVGVELDGGQLDRLLELVRLWRAYAPAINLVGAHDDVAMLGHVADGLATIACAGRAIRLGPAVTWLDVGAGAGLPGLVVAAASDCHVVLAEPRQKRAAFLELAIATIAAKADVIRVRIDEETWHQVAMKQKICADLTRITIASARAVLAVESWLRLGKSW